MSAHDPAFPARLQHVHPEYGLGDALFPGLTKREWFAGMVMQGILPNMTGAGIEDTADIAVQFADALIAELERTA